MGHEDAHGDMVYDSLRIRARNYSAEPEDVQ